MELACILSIVLLDYLDFGLILFLLFANATLGYYEEKQAGDAISALEASLSPICIVRIIFFCSFSSVLASSLV